jgi:hypothetical protein
MRRSVIVVALVGLVVPLGAQTRLVDRNGVVPDEAIVAAPLPASERRYADVDGRHLKSLIAEITAISRTSRDAGDRMWGRMAGTAAEKKTNAWVEARFRSLGLQDIRRQDFTLPPQWFPKNWTVTVSGGGKTFTAASLLPAPGSPSTPPGGLDLEAVWVGTGTAADFAGREVRGKAVFIHDIPTPGTINHSVAWTGAISRALGRGAAALFVVYGISDNWAVWQSIAGPSAASGRAGADTAANVPGFYMGFRDGVVVRDMIGTGQPVRVRATLEVEIRSGLTSANVYGMLPGTTEENILILAHQDGYFDAALDNASGIATMIGLAEHFAKVPRGERRRSIVFVGTAGHHAGSLGTRWMHDNRNTFLANTALTINCEHMSVVDTQYWGATLRKVNAVAGRRWWTYGSDQLVGVVTSALRTFGVPVLADMDPNASGDMGVMSRDLPSVQTIQSPEIKHTDADTVEWVPAAGLEAVTRAYAKIIDEVNKLDRAALVKNPATTSLPRR